MDILLQPFLNKIKSYIAMTSTFFNLIPQKKKKTDPDTLKVTFDATNLYCSIHLELEKQAALFWIEKYSETLHPRFNKNIITDGKN